MNTTSLCQAHNEFNTTTGYFPESCIHVLFEQQAIQTPHAIALEFQNKTLTYTELNNRADQVAQFLLAQGIQTETLVGIMLERSFDMFIAILGILKAGGAYLPIDPNYPSDRIVHILQDSRLAHLITTNHFINHFHDLSRINLYAMDKINHFDFKISAQSNINTVKSNNLAYVIYTSGSTGKPKGVMIEHKNVCNMAWYVKKAFGLTANSRMLQFASMSFDAAVSEWTATLISGGTLCLGNSVITPVGTVLADVIDLYNISVIKVPPTILHDLPERAYPRLKTVITAGEKCSDVLLRRWGKNRTFINCYGPTEATVGATMAIYHDTNHEITIGKPNANTEIYILDEELRTVPVGECGEIYIGGVGVARGYLNNSALTNEKFISNIFNPKYPYLYKTGDIASWLPNGNIRYIGRKDNQVKLRGVRIELEEIEVCAQRFENIATCAAGLDTDKNGKTRIVLYFVSKNSRAFNFTLLNEHITKSLPVHMQPNLYVSLKYMPLTPNKKIDRHALAPSLGTIVEQNEKDNIFNNITTQQLAAIWADLLSIDIKKIGLNDNFFSLGGDSLLSIKFLHKMQENWSIYLPIHLFFVHPTIAYCNQYLESHNNNILNNQFESKNLANELVPLTDAQKRLWYLYELEQHSAFYNIFNAFHITGNLNITALEEALYQLMTHQEILKTKFIKIDNDCYQRLIELKRESFKLSIVDLSEYNPTERLHDAYQICQNEAKRPFDLIQENPFVVRLLKLGNEKYILILKLHHIIADGWSMQLLYKQLAAAYYAKQTQCSMFFQPLQLQYANYASEQRYLINNDDIKNALDYWQQQLSGLPTLNLPIDYPRPLKPTYKGSTFSVKLEKSLANKLAKISQQSGTTLFNTFLSIFGLLLHQYSSQEDIPIGTTTANRNDNALQSLIGFFANTVVLRLNLAENISFIEYLQKTSLITQEAYAHQAVPFEKIVETLQPNYHPGMNPLFQVMLVYTNSSAEKFTLPDLKVKPLKITNHTAKFDLTLFLTEESTHWNVSFEYKTAIFKRATIKQLAQHFCQLIKVISENPEYLINNYSMLLPNERRKILVDWNNTNNINFYNKTLHQAFETQVEKTPLAIALKYQDQEMSYQSLNIQANQIAHYLRENNVTPDTIVAVCLERSAEFVIAVLGILKAGGAYLPLDPAYPTERLCAILSDSKAKVLITQKKLTDIFSQQKIPMLLMDDDSLLLQKYPTFNLSPAAESQHLAYVIYTSGSTGKPKGVLQTHGGITSCLMAMQEKLCFKTTDRVLQQTSIGFDVSVEEIFHTLSVGGCLVIFPSIFTGDVHSMLNCIQQQQITVLNAVPSFLYLLLQSANPQQLISLRLVIAAGENLPSKLQRLFFKKLQAELINCYGPTEAFYVTYYNCTLSKNKSGSIPIGKPLSNQQIFILDKYQKPVAIGVPGEIYIGGIALARGYVNRPEMTAEKFIKNPIAAITDNNQECCPILYRTGDLARYLSDGNIEYLGRIDHQVKLRGFRIELGEIENILQQQAGIKDTVVLLKETGNMGQSLVAYIVNDESLNDTAKNTGLLREALSRQLPEYMLPSHYVFLDKLPLTPNGKLDKNALPEPNWSEQSNLKNYIAPRNEVEKILAQIWLELLAIDKISIYDNFFSVGGHSLLATQLITRIRKQINVELPLKTVLEKPTIAEICQQIALFKQHSNTNTKLPPLLSQKRPLRIPLSYAQQRLWFLDQLLPNASLYNIPISLRLNGKLDKLALQHAFQKVLQRHESLRTHFETIKNKTYQVIKSLDNDALVKYWREENLINLAHTEQRKKLKLIIQRENYQLFDLSSGFLLKICAIQLATEEHILLLTIHHSIIDGWSIEILLNELGIYYQAFLDKKDPLLEPLAIQYADYTIWQRNWLQGEVLNTQLQYWQKQLSGIPDLLALPTDKVRPKLLSYHGKSITMTLDSKQLQLLKLFADSHQVTLYMVLLSALNSLLHHYSAQEDIVIGTPIANRTSQEMENLIGFFVNTIALRCNIHGNMTYSELLAQIKATTLEAYSHQDIPFEYLVECLKIPRALNRNPIFQVLFALQNHEKHQLNLPGIKAEPLPNHLETAKFDISIFAVETIDNTLKLSWNYATDLFTEDTISLLAKRFIQILEKIVFNTQDEIQITGLLGEYSLKSNRLSTSASSDKMNINANTHLPQTKTEKRIFKIWQQVLKQKTIAIDDDFFDRGGHSLLLVKLVNKINTKFNLQIPLSAYYQNKTICLQALLIEQNIKLNHLTLIPLKTGEKQQQLFLIHPMAGSAICYQDLANNINSNINIVGIDKPNLPENETFTTIYEMASYYADMITKLQPEGPYYLGGWSFSGVLAYEIAALLFAKGHHIANVFMFDSYAFSSNKNISYFTDNKIIEWGTKHGYLNSRYTVNERNAFIKNYKDNLYLLKNYKPTVTDIPISLFKCNHVAKKYSIYQANNWEEYSSHIDIYPINCSHYNIIKMPFVQQVTVKIDQMLGDKFKK